MHLRVKRIPGIMDNVLIVLESGDILLTIHKEGEAIPVDVVGTFGYHGLG